MTKYILTDVDETVLGFADAFHVFMEDNGYFSHQRLRDQYGVAEVFGISEDQAVAEINRFFETQIMCEGLVAEPDARIALRSLHELGYAFVAITAVPNTPAVVEARKANLERVFGFPWEVHCVGVRGDKTETLSRYPASIWVEDHAGHAAAGAKLGHTAFLLERAYNCDDVPPNVHLVKNWLNIRRFVMEAA